MNVRNFEPYIIKCVLQHRYVNVYQRLRRKTEGQPTQLLNVNVSQIATDMSWYPDFFNVRTIQYWTKNDGNKIKHIAGER